jgi:hypothetical protein
MPRPALRWLLLCALLFGGGAAVARDPEPLALQGYSSIALTRLKSGHLVLQAHVNGVPGRFVLDTGAGRSVIETTRHARFRLARIDATTSVAIGAGGNVPLRMSHGNRLQLGSYVDYGFTAYLMPLQQVNLAFLRRGQERIDGVIGADVLRGGAAVIDYAGGMLYLKPRAGTAATATTTSETPQR